MYMRKFVVVFRVSACYGSLRIPRNGEIFFFLPFSSVIQLKWVFLTAYTVKLSSEFGLVLSRWLHPRLDYSLGFKPGPILRDAVWHFSLAYKRLPLHRPCTIIPVFTATLTTNWTIVQNPSRVYARAYFTSSLVAFDAAHMKATVVKKNPWEQSRKPHV